MNSSPADQPWSIEFFPAALEDFDALDGSIRTVLKKKIANRARTSPHIPKDAKRGDLAGCYVIEALNGWRLLYRPEDKERVILVIGIGLKNPPAPYDKFIARMGDFMKWVEDRKN